MAKITCNENIVLLGLTNMLCDYDEGFSDVDVSDVVKITELPQATAEAVLSSLESKGLIRAQADEINGAQKIFFHVTEAGKGEHEVFKEAPTELIGADRVDTPAGKTKEPKAPKEPKAAKEPKAPKEQKITKSSLVREQIALAKAEGRDQASVAQWAVDNLEMDKPLAKVYVRNNWDKVTVEAVAEPVIPQVAEPAEAPQEAAPEAQQEAAAEEQPAHEEV